jgi:hypothetical protein
MLELEENAEYELESPRAKGSIVQAEIVGNHSCVSVRLELK